MESVSSGSAADFSSSGAPAEEDDGGLCMILVFLQAGTTIYDKFDALQQRGAEDSFVFWQVVSIGLVATVLLIGLLYFVRAAQQRRAGRRGKGVGSLVDEELVETNVPLTPADLAPGDRAWVFWDVDGTRCGCDAVIGDTDGGLRVLEVESGLVPMKGRVDLVVPESDGNVVVMDLVIQSGNADSRRVPSDAKTNRRIHRKCRVRCDFPIAAVRAESQADPLALRAMDVSLDGIGFRSESRFTVGEVLTLRLHLPEFIDAVTVRAEVSWQRADVGGLSRGGLRISADDAMLRAYLAELVLSCLAQAS